MPDPTDEIALLRAKVRHLSEPLPDDPGGRMWSTLNFLASREGDDMETEVAHWASKTITHLRARVAELEAENQQYIAKLHCMCGSSMDHSAWEGHTPVSMYSYDLLQAQERVAELEAALPLALRWMGRMPGVVGSPPEQMDEFMEAVRTVSKLMPSGPVAVQPLEPADGR